MKSHRDSVNKSNQDKSYQDDVNNKSKTTKRERERALRVERKRITQRLLRVLVHVTSTYSNEERSRQKVERDVAFQS